MPSKSGQNNFIICGDVVFGESSVKTPTPTRTFRRITRKYVTLRIFTNFESESHFVSQKRIFTRKLFFLKFQCESNFVKNMICVQKNLIQT